MGGPILDTTFEDIGSIEERLGYVFSDRSLILEALTHSSFANERASPDGEVRHNERLEFLGDAVLQLVISTFLVQEYPCEREGALSKMRTALVDGKGLKAVGVGLGLPGLLRIGQSLRQSPQQLVSSTLPENAVEAILGAVYLDGGFGAAEAVIRRLLKEKLQAQQHTTVPYEDYKSDLQEFFAKHRPPARPAYRIVKEEGPDHERQFTAVVEADGIALGEGVGSTKKDAEKVAAKNALSRISREAAPSS